MRVCVCVCVHVCVLKLHGHVCMCMYMKSGIAMVEALYTKFGLFPSTCMQLKYNSHYNNYQTLHGILSTSFKNPGMP